MRKVGSGKFVYEEVKGWGQFPNGCIPKDIPAVAVDSQDRVYAFARNTEGDCVIIFSPEGDLISSWGARLFIRPHGMFIGPDDAVYCVDDRGHALYKFTADGQLLMKIETADHPADTGYVFGYPDTVLRSGPPFNCPTWLALSPEGDLYVTDGYGNARVHKFTPDGQLILSWGEPGDGPGEFMTPHSVLVDKMGLVYVADRMNSRIQVFNPQGEFLDQWRGVRWPNGMCFDTEGNLYVAELGEFLQYKSGVWQFDYSNQPGRITVRDRGGRILTEWSAEDPLGADLSFAPHGIAVDSRGNLYISQVPEAFRRNDPEGYRGNSSEIDAPGLLKYVRI